MLHSLCSLLYLVYSIDHVPHVKRNVNIGKERNSIDSIGIFFIFIFVFYVCCYGFPKPGGAIQRERPLGTGQHIGVLTLG